MSDLKSCWEIKNCGRQLGGPKAAEFGVCVAAKEDLGHSCWAIAGTLCGGKVQGTSAEKEHNCMACELYTSYNRMSGSHGKEIEKLFPAEQKKYQSAMLARVTNLAK
jgi:hypothetical protein